MVELGCGVLERTSFDVSSSYFAASALPGAAPRGCRAMPAKADEATTAGSSVGLWSASDAGGPHNGFRGAVPNTRAGGTYSGTAVDGAVRKTGYAGKYGPGTVTASCSAAAVTTEGGSELLRSGGRDRGRNPQSGRRRWPHRPE